MVTEAPEDQKGKFRHYNGLAAILIKALGAGSGLFFALYLAGIFAYFRIFLLSNQFNAIFMAVVLVLTFLLQPAGKKAPRDRLPWYDAVLVVISLVGCVYIIVNARDLAYFGRISATSFEIALGAVTVLALMEAVRRTFGWAMVIITAIFVLYAKFGYLMPGGLKLFYFNCSMLTSDIYLSSSGIFGTLTSIASGIIVAFVIFGTFFVAAGGGRFFLNLALAITGSMSGGPAKAAIIGSALFGTISGSPAANVVVTGSVTIPLMKSIGYKPHYAGAVEAVASTGGAITPPIMSGVAFVMAMLVGKPYSYIALISALPAFLYYVSLFTQVHLQAVKQNYRGLPLETLPSVKTTLKEGWELLVPFLVLIALLFVLRYPAEVAALHTIAALIIISMFRRQHRINLKRFVDSLEEGILDTLPIANIIALAGIILAVLTVTGLGPKLSAALVNTFGHSAVLLVIASGMACYILGMGISFIASYILVASLVAPALLKLGIPIIVSHFFIMYMVLSTNFTPPYCTAAYVAGGIAKAHPFRVGFQAMRLGIVCFLVPFVIVLNPALLLIGPWMEVVLAAITAILGVIGLSVGIEGYLFTKANWFQRVMFIIGGILLTIPGLATDLPGLALLGLGTLWQWKALRDTRRYAAPIESPREYVST